MSDPVVTLATPPAPADVDANGMLTKQHVSAGVHWTTGNDHGELLLCGTGISYVTYNGTAPAAPICERCEALDC